jgi:hypothetical protein
VKLIYILRNPLDRIASRYRTAGLFPRRLCADQGFLRELLISDYWLQLSQFREFYRAGNLLLLCFDDLIGDQFRVIHSVCDFLCLDSVQTAAWLSRLRPMHANLSSDQINSLTDLRNTSAAQALKAGVPLPFKLAYKRIEHSLSGLIPGLSRPSTWQPDPASVEVIRRTLQPGMRRLSEDFGVDLAHCFGMGWSV